MTPQTIGSPAFAAGFVIMFETSFLAGVQGVQEVEGLRRQEEVEVLSSETALSQTVQFVLRQAVMGGDQASSMCAGLFAHTHTAR